ncbi:MAG: response regulator transcription factor [Anaerovoracaceae bacterium]
MLLLEDEEKIARFIEHELSHEGYEIDNTFNGREGLEMVEQNHFDLILLDIMLPELNGLEVLRRIRKFSEVPVIMLTARDAVMDKVSGLDMGADDYITKPFAIEELLARIRVALKRKSDTPKDKKENILSAGKLTLDISSHEVYYDGQKIDLTNREFILLRTLLENKSIVLSRDTLLEKVWGYDYMGETNVVDVYVYYLRNKINEKIIETVRGVGYVIK